jgi:hypothetical protein
MSDIAKAKEVFYLHLCSIFATIIARTRKIGTEYGEKQEKLIVRKLM